MRIQTHSVQTGATPLFQITSYPSPIFVLSHPPLFFLGFRGGVWGYSMVNKENKYIVEIYIKIHNDEQRKEIYC